jgi:hypothetical protein
MGQKYLEDCTRPLAEGRAFATKGVEFTEEEASGWGSHDPTTRWDEPARSRRRPSPPSLGLCPACRGVACSWRWPHHVEAKAEALWPPLFWVCSIGAWGALLWGCVHLTTALFRSDNWLLSDFARQTGSGLRDEVTGSSREAPLNQRLDEMGPRYRAIFGALTRVLAVIENAASKKPPRMTTAQFEMTIELLESSAAELREAAKESEY